MATLDTSLQLPTAHGDTGAVGALRLSARATRLIALAGLGSFALIIVAAFVAPPLWNAPGTNSSAAHVAAYLQVNHGRTIASLFIYSLGMGLFLCFTGGLCSWLRQVEPAPQPLSAVFAFGAIALAVLIFAAFATAGVMSYRPQQPAFAAALSDMTFGLLALSGIPTAVCLGAYAALVLRHRCLPAWTGWLAVLAMDAHILIAASFLSHGSFVSLEGVVIIAVPATFFTWILATSVVLLRAGEKRTAVT
ncbi:MAG TPA: hypothetical protein VKG38_18390 [Solirubrobacteraceae bacterium]|nr:hypothetical protein [Solirubrobacteraceae bacterium]